MSREHDIAERILKCTLQIYPPPVVIGDVTSLELAYLASKTFTTCPACGAEAWCDIDCKVCQVVSDIETIVEGKNRGEK